jgi:hypothetical protein
VAGHAARARGREERIEKVVAAIGTVLVLLVFLSAGGRGLLEGAAGYVVAGVVIWLFAKRTFFPRRRETPKTPLDEQRGEGERLP